MRVQSSAFNPLSAKILSKVKVTSPSGFPVPYHFSISLMQFRFQTWIVQERICMSCIPVIWHLKG